MNDLERESAGLMLLLKDAEHNASVWCLSSCLGWLVATGMFCMWFYERN